MPDADPATPPVETTDRTIRNQRDTGWPASAWIGLWAGLWVVAGIALASATPRPWGPAVAGVTILLMLGSCLALLIRLDRRPSRRLRLGDELRAYPFGRWQPADILAIHLAPDPDEDYVEGQMPFPVCLVTVEGKHGRKRRLVASVGDAVRVREWAERKGIAVIDPEGYSTGGARKNPD
jgi:hypothetical protein